MTRFWMSHASRNLASGRLAVAQPLEFAAEEIGQAAHAGDASLGLGAAVVVGVGVDVVGVDPALRVADELDAGYGEENVMALVKVLRGDRGN